MNTVSPYGCNNNISGVGNLSSSKCSRVNVIKLFPSFQRRKRSHGHIHYYTPSSLNITSLSELVNIFDGPMRLHHVRSKLHSLPLKSLHNLSEDCLSSPLYSQNSREYKVKCIVHDIANCRLFKPVNSSLTPDNNNHRFLKLNFANKGIDVINICSILHHKSVMNNIPLILNVQKLPRFPTLTLNLLHLVFLITNKHCKTYILIVHSRLVPVLVRLTFINQQVILFLEIVK